MKNNRQGRRGIGRLTALAAVLTAVCMLAMPAAAATVTASDVMIRNSGEEKDNNIIGVLNEGDKVTVISKTVDSNGTEWYYIELPNHNTGYVKAQWVDNGGKEVETVQAAAPAEQEEPAAQEEAGNGGEEPEEASETEAGREESPADIEDWTQDASGEDQQVPVTGGGAGTDVSAPDGTSTEMADSQDEVDGGTSYDPFTDRNAQFSINFITENDGSGNWYIYNYDTDKRIRIGDLEKLSDAQTAAQKNASAAGRWRLIACILLILLAALLIFLYVVIGRNTRPSPSSGRARRRREPRRYEEDDEDDEFDFLMEEEPAEDESAEEDTEETSEAEDAAEAEDEADDEEDPDRNEEEDLSPAPAAAADSGADAGKAVRSAESDPEEEDQESEESGEEEEDEAEEEDDYGDEEDDYEDEDDDYGDEDDYEEEAPRRRGGFIGFLKSVFSSDGLVDDDDYEDEEEEEDEDDYGDDEEEEYEEEEYAEDEDEPEEEEDMEEEEPPVRRNRGRKAPSARSSRAPRRTRQARNFEFDEELDYPEDADLIPDLKKPGKPAGEKYFDEEEVPGPAPSGRSKGAASGKGRKVREEYEEEDFEEFFADDEDDMEYAFLSSSPKRGPRK